MQYYDAVTCIIIKIGNGMRNLTMFMYYSMCKSLKSTENNEMNIAYHMGEKIYVSFPILCQYFGT